MLGEMISESARRFGDRTAIVAPDGLSLSYTELDRLSDEVGAGLQSRGIGEGDVVALVLPPGPEYLACYLAAAKVGAVTAGVNDKLSPPERARLLEIAGPKLVVSTAELLWELRVEGGVPRRHRGGPGSPVAIVFTSGTTGIPKGALFCNRQLSAITEIDVGREWGAGGRMLLGTSMAHLGPMTKLAGNLKKGVTMLVTTSWNARDALALTERHRLTTVSGIPTQVALMMRDPSFETWDLSSVRSIVMGGGPATPALVNEARRRFQVPVLVRYSCTEAGIGLGTNPGDPDEDAEVSVGRPQPGVELTVRDSDDEVVGAGEIGEVCLASAAVMSCYWRDPEATRLAMTRDGAVRTGDLGWIDDRGRLRLSGRRKEMYVRGGYNVYPAEVESVLADHPYVAAVAVVPRSDAVMGEVGVAVVVQRAGTVGLTLEELRGFAASRLASYKLPSALLVVDEMPLTAMHKVDRARLGDLVSSSQSRAWTVPRG